MVLVLVRTEPRRRIVGFSCALLCGLLASFGPAGAEPTFIDRTLFSGLTYMPASAAGVYYAGGTVGDFDNDGWPDVFLLGCGDVADALFMNNRDGTFTDRAADWGVDLFHRGHGAAAGDYNDDGWLDIYVTSTGDMTAGPRAGQHMLYRNNGDGSFTDVASAAGVNQTSSTWLDTTSPAFGDYDLDGDLDLFVTTWASLSQQPDGNRLFRNDGNGSFTDVTVAAGVFDTTILGYSPRFVDMNGDRYPELLIAGDYGSSRYFVNDTDGTFTDGTSTSGTAVERYGMGQTVADFNNDGLPDWYVTSIYRVPPIGVNGNQLYINQGNHVYSVLPQSAGVTDGGWGWGVAAHDYDHDGWVDIVETNGWPFIPDYVDEPSYVFVNNGDQTFTESHRPADLESTFQGRSVMTLDHDRDGDLDVLIASAEEPLQFFRNDISGSNANWLVIRLDTSAVPGLAPHGVGTRLVATAGGVSRTTWISGGSNYLGQSELLAHFGLGPATVVDTLDVEWADGTTTTLTAVPANQRITLAAPIGGASGEASRQSVPPEQMRAAYDSMSGLIDLTYTPGCNTVDHTIYYGDLADVGTHLYSGAQCLAGSSGSVSFDPGGLDDAFFVLVGNTGVTEGSYGTWGPGAERPEDLATPGCDLPQDLAATCP